MSVGTIATKVLTDIANAIRQQNGANSLYAPAQLPAAVATLDGVKSGDGRIEPYKELGRGVLSDKVFAKIADAIREQNGTGARYAPDEMAAAILALEWDGGLKPRALLLSDGTFELNFLDGRRTTTDCDIVRCWNVAESYATPSERPWNTERDSIKRVVFHESWQGSGICDYTRWFDGCTSLVDVSGFENLGSQLKLGYMFASCTGLETVYATEFDPSAADSCFGMFYGCRCLVGGEGYVPSISEGRQMLSLGPSGALTDPGNDLREWAWCHLYADGELTIGDEEQGNGREELANGRICLTAAYRATNFRPWYNDGDKVLKATVLPGAKSKGQTNISYWLYNCGNCAAVEGLGNLAHVQEMDQAFNTCSSIEVLDFRGFDPKELTSLVYTFAGCAKLKTIYVDESWSLPDSASGSGTFLGCEALVGGQGTAYSASYTNSYRWFSIDRGEDDPGYLTAK